MLEAASLAPMAAIFLGFPPSTNNLFRNGARGRFRSPEYDVWIAEAGFSIRRQRPEPIVGAFRADIVFNRPDERRRDIDNLAKAILDILVKTQVVVDDSLCVDLRLRWSAFPAKKPGSCLVLLEAVGG